MLLRQAFTLLELIVAIVVISLLSALAIPTFASVTQTTKLETAETTAASVSREILALSKFDGELITNQHVIDGVKDLNITAVNTGVHAASATASAVTGRWEFSTGTNVISAVRAGSPMGAELGIAIGIPGAGCAFARSADGEVKTWHVKDAPLTSCNGLGALITPEEVLELKAPPVPGGLSMSWGCSSTEGQGWSITFEGAAIDVYINGKYIGTFLSGACVPGAKDDIVVVVENPLGGGVEAGWEGGAGELYDDLVIDLPQIPEEEEEGTPETSIPGSAAGVSNGSIPLVVTWDAPAEANGVIISRRPVTGGASGGYGDWSPVHTGTGDAYYDTPAAGEWAYSAQPTLNGVKLGPAASTYVSPAATPAIINNAGQGAPTLGLMGNSAILTWGAVPDTKNAPLTGYRVYISVNNGPLTLINSPSPSVSPSFTNGPLEPGTYCYQLSAWGMGGESEKTAPVCVTVKAPVWGENGIFQSRVLPTASIFGGARLGASVAVSGDTMVVGAPNATHTATGNLMGAAYVFTRSGDTWAYKTRLTTNGAQAYDTFGASVAINEGTIVVGAPARYNTRDNVGVAYVYTLDASGNWVAQTTLNPPVYNAGARFGQSVAVTNGTIAVGAPGDTVTVKSGVVHTFVPSGTSWTAGPKLLPADTALNNAFGQSLDIDGSTMVIGSYGVYNGASTAGAAYVFTKTGTAWSQQAKLKASNPAAGDYFGWSVALQGDVIAVGAHKKDSVGGLDSGAAYVFTRSGAAWAESATLQAADGTIADEFGTSVEVAEGKVLVGSPMNDEHANNAGAVYVFNPEAEGWKQSSKLLPQGYKVNTLFGTSVASLDNLVMVGAPSDPDRGVVYSHSSE